MINRPKIKPSNRDQIEKILKENHDSAISGHSEFHRTYGRIRDNYKWPKMKDDIKEYINKCHSCQLNKSSAQNAKAPMQIATTSERPFQRISIDIVGPLPITETGNRFAVTMQDDLTKYSFARPCPNHESKTIANILIEFITIFGIPESILSDNGTDFTSNLIKEVNNIFKIRHVFTSLYHPQSNGSLERSHHTLKEYLRDYLNSNQTNWDEYIQFAMFTYNSHYHRATNFTPHELLFGHKLHIPNSLTRATEFRYTYDDYHTNLKLKLNQSFQIARQNLLHSKESSKAYYD